MKKLAALIICIAMLSGCVPHTELDKQGIAEAVGVDLEGGVYTITVQYFNPDSSGGVTAIDSTAPNATVAEGKGRTIEEALQALSYTSGKEMMLGAVSLIVFGEGALSVLDDALTLAASHYSGNLRANIALAKGKAADIMNVRFKEGSASVEKLEGMLANAEKLGLTRPVMMYEALEGFSSSRGCTALPQLLAYPADSDTTEDGSAVIIAGGAVCTNSGLTGELSVREMSGLDLIAPGDQSSGECELTLTCRGRDTRVVLYGADVKIQPELHDKKLGFDMKLAASCKIVSTALTEPYAHKREIERICEDELTERVSAVLEAALKQHGADIFRLEYIIRAYSPELWKAISDNYDEYLKQCEFTVSAAVNMERFGILVE